jgi:hypothetical protein
MDQKADQERLVAAYAAETGVNAQTPRDNRFDPLKLNRIGRRIIMCMLLIATLAVIWNLLGR